MISAPQFQIEKFQNHPFHQCIQHVRTSSKKVNRTLLIRDVLGFNPKLAVLNGGSDGNHLIRAGVPCVIFGVEGRHLHSENEHAFTKSILQMAKIYALTAEEYLQNGPSFDFGTSE